jgi:hypothetical protein
VVSDHPLVGDGEAGSDAIEVEVTADGVPIVRRFASRSRWRRGTWTDFECLHDNGVERPLRTDAAGNAVPLTFGLGAEDETCVLTGTYYRE